jgi:hypothetical protein
MRAPVRVYAFAPRPDIDRLVTTSAPMMEDTTADVVQVWRLSDLALLHTLQSPTGATGRWHRAAARTPAPVRAARDGGRVVLLNAYAAASTA